MGSEMREAGTRVGGVFAADIYSLGTSLYELLPGRPPFVGHNRAQIFMQVLTVEPVAPRQFVASIPPDLETICMKSLEKDPSKRYQSAEALANDLRRVLEGRPIVARPLSRAEQATRWCRRNPLVAAVAVLLVARTLSTSLPAAQAWRQTRRAADTAAPTR